MVPGLGGGVARGVDCGVGCGCGAAGSKEGRVSAAPAGAAPGLMEPFSTSLGETISTMMAAVGATSNGSTPAKIRPNARITIWPMHDMAKPEPLNSFGSIFPVNVFDALRPLPMGYARRKAA